MDQRKATWALVLFTLGAMAYLWFSEPLMPVRPSTHMVSRQEPVQPPRPQVPAVPTTLPTSSMPQAKPPPLEVPNEKERKSKKPVLHYKIDDGIAVALGDVAIGAPTKENFPEKGLAEISLPGGWGTNVIPYHIQPSISQPERVLEAIALFKGTPLRFVPYTNQEDALVFEPTAGVCKSYLGKIGGKQPIWIAPGCGATEIAHEIMHALGFVHEQNRTERDDYIFVHFENIEGQYQFNFEKLPLDFMKVSGLSTFDFESIMVYPVWMFSERGQPTMESRVPDQQIRPGRQLSKFDIERINRAYGDLSN